MEHEPRVAMAMICAPHDRDDVRHELLSGTEGIVWLNELAEIAFAAGVEAWQAGEPIGNEFEPIRKRIKDHRAYNAYELGTWLANYQFFWYHYRYYLQRMRRQNIYKEFESIALTENPDSEKKLDQLSHVINKLHSENDARPVSEILLDVIAEFDDHSVSCSELKTGWPDLDRSLNGGLRKGQLTILAARPGVGKTTFAVNLCERYQGKHVLFFSLEMTAKMIVDRLLSCFTTVRLNAIETGTLGDQMFRVVAGSKKIAEWPLDIVDDSKVSSVKIAKLVSVHKPDVVIVDYLTLIENPHIRDEQRYREVARISRELKKLATDNDCAVIALAQLGREIEQTKRLPRLSDLRESGNIEQDADVVLFLHSSEAGKLSSPEIDLIVAKNRNGMKRKIPMVFFAEKCRFEERVE